MKDNKGQVNIWIAASDGDLITVKNYIEVTKLDVNTQDENGYSPLHAAVSYDHYELTQYLLEKGADSMLKDNDLETPLHYCGSVRCAELLVVNGADPEAKNDEGLLPYDSAMEEENTALANYLLPLTPSADPSNYEPTDLDHVEHDDPNQIDLPNDFINQVEQVMQNTTNGTEQDAQLSDLVLNLITKNVNKN